MTTEALEKWKVVQERLGRLRANAIYVAMSRSMNHLLSSEQAQSDRRCLEQGDKAREQQRIAEDLILEASDALLKLTNEASGFLSMADMETHGQTNIKCLHDRILGARIVLASRGLTLNGLIEIQKAVPNFRQRWCTRMLKIEPTIAWCVRNRPVLMHVGLRADEDEREGIYSDSVQSRFPFREWGWGLTDVTDYLELRGIEIPTRTDCARCYHQRLGEWRNLWRDYPHIYWEASAQETKLGHTFRSPGRDTWPSDLASLAREFSNGRKIRGDGKQGSICRVCSL